jgi:hypothetical protein
LPPFLTLLDAWPSIFVDDSVEKPGKNLALSISRQTLATVD